jgi:hypothetical protein
VLRWRTPDPPGADCWSPAPASGRGRAPTGTRSAGRGLADAGRTPRRCYRATGAAGRSPGAGRASPRLATSKSGPSECCSSGRPWRSESSCRRRRDVPTPTPAGRNGDLSLPIVLLVRDDSRPSARTSGPARRSAAVESRTPCASRPGPIATPNAEHETHRPRRAEQDVLVAMCATTWSVNRQT